MKTHKLVKLPRRHEQYHGLVCSARRWVYGCRRPVEFIASYSWKKTTAERLYCPKHAGRFARRYGLQWRVKA